MGLAGTQYRAKRWLRSDRILEHVALWSAIVLIQTWIVLVYVYFFGVDIMKLRYTVYPFVWINLAIAAVMYASRISVDRRFHLLASMVAGGYFILLLLIPGKIAIGGDPTLPVGLNVRRAIPGWGPIITYNGAFLRAHLIPFEVLGYAGLSYLVYVNVLRITRMTLAGIVGVATCVGCTVPVLVPVLGILGGTGSTLASTAYAWSYDVGTILFVLIVIVLFRSQMVIE